jgi:hypothetical protein
MGALNLPSAADIERLTRRLRSVSQRLEGIEDGVHRLDRTLQSPSVEARLGAVEEQLRSLSRSLLDLRERIPDPRAAKAPAGGTSRAAKASPRAARADKAIARTPGARTPSSPKAGARKASPRTSGARTASARTPSAPKASARSRTAAPRQAG